MKSESVPLWDRPKKLRLNRHVNPDINNQTRRMDREHDLNIFRLIQNSSLHQLRRVFQFRGTFGFIISKRTFSL